jgi:hypothetical protein
MWTMIKAGQEEMEAVMKSDQDKMKATVRTSKEKTEVAITFIFSELEETQK